MNREKRIYYLQDIYVMTRADSILALLYEEIKTLAEKIICKKQPAMPYDKQKEFAEDAAFRFLQMYLTNKNWECFNFPVRLGLDVTYVIHSPTQKKLDYCQQIEDDTVYEPEPKSESTYYVLQDLKEDSENWKKIILICFRSRSFKSFILKLSQIESRQWIYDHVKRLKCLYKYTRRTPVCRKKRVGIAAFLESAE